MGVPGGLEGAVYAASSFAQALDSGKMLVKLGFSNAFNSLHRRHMLCAVASEFPALFTLNDSSAYANPSVLCFNGATILSAEGFNRGTV